MKYKKYEKNRLRKDLYTCFVLGTGQAAIFLKKM